MSSPATASVVLRSVSAVIATLAEWLPDQAMTFLAETTVRCVILLLAAWLATRLMAKSAAALRHLVWHMALWGIVALPFLGAVVPAWRVLPKSLSWGAGLTSASRAEEVSTRSAAAPADAGPPDSGNRIHDNENAPVSAVVSMPSRPGTWITLAWVVGGCMVIAQWGLARVRLWQLTRRARAFDDALWASSLEEACRRMGVRRSVRLLIADRGTMPMVWGVARPTILLPEEARDWPAENRGIVLLHELAHVRRWDGVALLACHAAAVLCWFNPLFWLARSRVLLESECACDDEVLRAGSRPSSYAERLLGIVAQCGGRQPARPAAIAMARPGTLEGRLMAILDEKQRRETSRVSIWVTVGLAFVTTFTLAACRSAAGTRTAGSYNTLAQHEGRQRTAELSSLARTALAKPVNLARPYPLSYPNAPTDKIAVQYAVIELVKQAGLKYNWKTSFANTDPICRQWITPNISNMPLEQALDKILVPVGLKYEIVNDQVVLVRVPPRELLQRRVTLRAPYPQSYPNAPTDKIAVQYAVIEMARQAGLGYDWDTSRKNTDPVCRQWVWPSVSDVTLAEGLQQVLDPVGLTYDIVGNRIVLRRK